MHKSGDSQSCLFHSSTYQHDFEYTLSQVKGKVIPKKIIKRAGYLVCDCCKKYTELDEVYKKLDLKKLEAKLIKALNRTQGKPSKDCIKDPHPDCNSEDSHINRNIEYSRIVRNTEDSPTDRNTEDSHIDRNTEDSCIDRNTEDSQKERNTDGSHTDRNTEVSHIDSNTDDSCRDCDNDESQSSRNTEENVLSPSDNIGMDIDDLHAEGQSPVEIPPMISSCLHGNCDSAIVGLHRLLVIVDRCLRKKTRILEPRSLQREKKKEMQELKRGKYFHKVKKSEKVKYVTDTVTIKSHSITPSMIIGKRGRNIKALTQGNKDIKISFNESRPGQVTVHVKAKSVDRIRTVKTSIDQIYWDLVQERKRWQARQQMKQCQHDIEMANEKFFEDDEKDLARDHFERKASHQVSRSPPGSDTLITKPKVLDKDTSRCLNCLTPYDQSADGATACKYHPGYIGQDSKWTCCTRLFKGGKHASCTHEGKRDGHKINGCQRGRHNWRLHKTAKCSGRKQKH